MKCEKCGFDAPLQQWTMVEQSKLVQLSEQSIKDYEKLVDDKEGPSEGDKFITKLIFRFLGQAGLMPYHSTSFACPQCGAILGRTD